MIIRKHYLDELLKYKDTEFIKVITGIRRSGKSYLLRMYHNTLIDSGVDENHIFYLNFEDYAHADLLDDRSLFAYLEKRVVKGSRSYFLFDEIQLVENWQKVINSLRVSFESDVTVTGSNAQMLSSEISTFLSGRYVELKMYPLSFVEYLQFNSLENLNERELLNEYQQYVRYGGFPSVVLADQSIKETVLSGIYDTIILHDVGYRGAIKDPRALRSVVQFLASNIGQIVNPAVITNTLLSAHVKTSAPTVNRYLEMLEGAYLFFKSDRYDIRGKEYLRSKGKYYIADTGLRHIALGRKQDNLGSELENIVYLELLRRGYTVDVGIIDSDREIDFIARKMDEKLYIQVAYSLPEDSRRESDNLLKIPDNYRKIIITQRYEEETEVAGIPIINILDWLLLKTAHDLIPKF